MTMGVPRVHDVVQDKPAALPPRRPAEADGLGRAGGGDAGPNAVVGEHDVDGQVPPWRSSASTCAARS